MYQIYRDGKPFAGASSSKEFLEEGAKRLQKAYSGSTFEVRETVTGSLKAKDLVPGRLYRWTAANNRPCELVKVRTPDPNGNAMVEMMDCGQLFLGASIQLSEYEEEA